jgi:PAS domain S-box-containing protein
VQCVDNYYVNWDWFSAKSRSAKSGELPELEALGIPFVNSPHPMWVYDLRTLAFLEVNDAAIRAYGFSRREFLTMTLLDIRPNQDIQVFLHDWEHPRESTEENWRHVGKDGKVFPVSITSWELNFRGRQAELVMARREVPHAGHISQADIFKPPSIRQNASGDSMKYGAED